MMSSSGSASPVASTTRDRLREIAHVALDMDGTIYKGGTLFSCTLPFIAQMRELGIGCTFLTNNPSKSSNDYLAHLRKMGLAANADELYTSAQATIDCLRRRFPEVRKIFALGTPSMLAEFRGAGFELTADDPNDVPDAVVVGFDMTRAAATQVNEAAGIGPEALDVVELQDCFTANELISYEA